jgi:hypothetical protein
VIVKAIKNGEMKGVGFDVNLLTPHSAVQFDRAARTLREEQAQVRKATNNLSSYYRDVAYRQCIEKVNATTCEYCQRRFWSKYYRICNELEKLADAANLDNRQKMFAAEQDLFWGIFSEQRRRAKEWRT